MVTVADLMKQLSLCDPAAPVKITVPAFIATADAMLENDEDLPDWHFEYDFPAVLQAGFVGYADGIPADARANAITNTLDPDDIEELWESRLLSIHNAQEQRAEGRDHD